MVCLTQSQVLVSLLFGVIDALVPHCKFRIDLIVIVYYKLAKCLSTLLAVAKQGMVVFVMDLPDDALGIA